MRWIFFRARIFALFWSLQKPKSGQYEEFSSASSWVENLLGFAVCSCFLLTKTSRNYNLRNGWPTRHDRNVPPLLLSPSTWIRSSKSTAFKTLLFALIWTLRRLAIVFWFNMWITAFSWWDVQQFLARLFWSYRSHQNVSKAPRIDGSTFSGSTEFTLLPCSEGSRTSFYPQH